MCENFYSNNMCATYLFPELDSQYLTNKTLKYTIIPTVFSNIILLRKLSFFKTYLIPALVCTICRIARITKNCKITHNCMIHNNNMN